MKTVFVDVARCIGCRHCETACALEHSSNKDLMSVLNDNPQPQPRIKVGLGIDFLTFPNRCRHCDPAPCMQICPTGAIYRNAEYGSVLVNEEKCISCGMCAMVCPFSTISFYSTPQTGKPVSHKCDDCIDRQNKNIRPACVEACKTGALRFGESNTVISRAKQEIVMKITGDIKGLPSAGEPENISMFKNIKEKIAALGPLPSSS